MGGGTGAGHGTARRPTAAALADACVAEGVAQGGGAVEVGGMAEGEGVAQGGGVAEGEGGDKSESEGGEGFPKDFDRENDEGCMEPAAARALLAAVDGYYRQLQAGGRFGACWRGRGCGRGWVGAWGAAPFLSSTPAAALPGAAVMA